MNPLQQLSDLGQSPWYDYITRDLLHSGELARLIAQDGLRGMTSNPTIFEKAISASTDYDADIRRLAAAGESPAEIFEALAVNDVRVACDQFQGVYRSTDGLDGLVSIEVAPTLAHDTEGTIREAKRLWAAIDRPNVMIKIPGTKAGLGAIERCIADGLNVNVTLLFDVVRYEEVIEAYLAGLEHRTAAHQPLNRIASVASFFVSRVDTKVDALLDGLQPAHPLRSQAAIANACAAYAAFERAVKAPRWQRLAQQGAQVQRPLWASTSTKDPQLADGYYVEALIGPHTVNTLPPATFAAYRDHGRPASRIADGVAAAPATLRRLADAGVDLAQVTAELENEGVAKFADSYRALLEGIALKARQLVGR